MDGRDARDDEDDGPIRDGAPLQGGGGRDDGERFHGGVRDGRQVHNEPQEQRGSAILLDAPDSGACGSELSIRGDDVAPSQRGDGQGRKVSSV